MSMCGDSLRGDTIFCQAILRSPETSFWSSTFSRYKSHIFSGHTVEPVITHTCRWKEKCMGYHRLWVFKDSAKKTLKLQVSAKYVSKLPLYD